MLEHEKLAILNSIKSEDELRTELVIPLLKKIPLSFSAVLDNQGNNEAGVDVIGISTSPFKKAEYTAFILKLGDITLKVADKKNNIVNIVETQIREAIRIPLTHPRLPSERLFATSFVVLTNGKISNHAEGVLRKSFPELNLDFIGQDRLIDKIDEVWPRFYEDRRPFLSSYAAKLLDTLNVINLEELGYTKKHRSLSDIYIDSLLYEEDSVSREELVFDLDKEPIAGADLCKKQHQLAVVTSGPGGGKTTLLKEITISQSKTAKEHVAVYLHARDVLGATDLIYVAAEKLSALSSDSVDTVLAEIKPAKLLLLVDGLDELATVSDRELVIEQLREAPTKWGARVILGTRPESNPTVLAALTAFKAYSIAPFKTSQIRSFFGKWFKDNTGKASKLLAALEDKGVFDKLPKTPMTMTLVAIVYESKEDIPSTLTELYEMFVGLLTGKWDSNRQIASAYDSQMKLSFLAKIAAVMQTEGLDSISSDRAISLADEFFANEATLKDVNSQGFIQSIIDRSHILVPTEDQQLRFSHMTFQEYFCAEYLIHDFPPNETIMEWFGDDWWREVLFFLAGKKKNVSSLIDSLLTSDFDDPETRITKLVTLGSMLQAGVLTLSGQKTTAVRFAATRFLQCYDDLERAVAQFKSAKLKSRISRVMLMSIIQQLYTGNFCSIHLQQALEKTYKDLPKDAENQGARFFVASALAKMRDFEPILEVATDPSMIDTSMYLLAAMSLSKEHLNEAQQNQYRRLKRRAAQFQQAVKREIGPLLRHPSAKRLAPPKKRTASGTKRRK